MSITIHFFRNRSLERIDYEKIFAFFDELGYCRSVVEDEQVDFICTNEQFDFSYHFLITKRSRVNSIYNLSSNYFNINLLVEIPVILPEVVYRDILKLVKEIADVFELEIYYSGVQDIEPFDMTKLLFYIANERESYLNSLNEEELKSIYAVERNKLHQICNFQQMMPYLPDKIKEDVDISPYIVMIDIKNNQPVFSILWQAGHPMIFPSHLDYIHIEEEEFVTIVPSDIFFKYSLRHMNELKGFLPDARLMLLNLRNARRLQHKVKKMKKFTVLSSEFKNFKLTDLIER